MTIELGWWLAPLGVTVLLFGWAFFACPKLERSYGMFSMPDLTPLFYYVPAAFGSLFAWFIWALLT